MCSAHPSQFCVAGDHHRNTVQTARTDQLAIICTRRVRRPFCAPLPEALTSRFVLAPAARSKLSAVGLALPGIRHRSC
ncbi:hypothetical protein MPS_2596 [Mycobacterium pseudoshottsii JCM 15466]|nr:hypothetical protein MMSP_1336 [Mycobacterium sp. 012931]GAQ35384.1 hypothetical protein MPS_2596 [Mycobacterium pseudoshottsii JCM 15466]